MDKFALYCRVSTTDQTNDNQIIRLIEYAKQRNWNYDLFEETESTRKTRPVKAAMLVRLRSKEYKGVIVYKLDRFARSSVELILEVQELVDKGIEFISISDNLNFGTAAGKLQFQILAAFSEFERALIRERTLEGLHRTKQQGTRLGRPKGSKDTKRRRKSGYILKEAKKRQAKDSANGNNKNITQYIDEGQ